MIRITYEYICDICRLEIHEKQVFEWGPYLTYEGDNMPAYNRDFALGHSHVCHACYQEAMFAALKRRAS